MKTSSAKAKGRRACAELADMLLRMTPELQKDDILVTPSGVTGDDLRFSPAAQKYFPWNVEVKNVEKLNIWSALNQAYSREQMDRHAILFFKRNRADMFVTMKADYFLKIVNDLNSLKRRFEDG